MSVPMQMNMPAQIVAKNSKGQPNMVYLACTKHGIGQKFTRYGQPQTDSKAERMVRTLVGMWQ